MPKPTNKKTFATLAILGIVLSIVSVARSSEPAESKLVEQEQVDPIVLRVDRGIRYLLRRSPCWSIAANGGERRNMARMIAKAARDHDVPPLLLTVTVKRESSFQPHVVGTSNGEIGVAQVHGLAAKGCDLATVPGQLACGARWLRKAHDKCGDWRGAVTAYMSGRCKAGKRSKLGKNVTSRLRQWERAEGAVERCEASEPEATAENVTQWLCEPPESRCVARIRAIKGDA